MSVRDQAVVPAALDKGGEGGRLRGWRGEREGEREGMERGEDGEGREERGEERGA